MSTVFYAFSLRSRRISETSFYPKNKKFVMTLNDCTSQMYHNSRVQQHSVLEPSDPFVSIFDQQVKKFDFTLKTCFVFILSQRYHEASYKYHVCEP